MSNGKPPLPPPPPYHPFNECGGPAFHSIDPKLNVFGTYGDRLYIVMKDGTRVRQWLEQGAPYTRGEVVHYKGRYWICQFWHYVRPDSSVFLGPNSLPFNSSSRGRLPANNSAGVVPGRYDSRNTGHISTRPGSSEYSQFFWMPHFIRGRL